MKKIVLLALAAGFSTMARAQDDLGFRDTPILPGGKWHVHDPDRPQPPVVRPGATPAAAPSDATILFDGRSLAAWRPEKKPWLLQNGVMTVPVIEGGAGALISRESFGDVQLHLEFRSPTPPTKTSQARGNSGVWFMQRYEVQILDSYQNRTYADGGLGAVYGWKPALANAARRPGEWQTYDIIFERPRFGADGHMLRPAYVTVLLNGVLVQNHQAMLGTTLWRHIAKYEMHGDAEPLQLQDHGSAVSFRNIWIRRLPAEAIAQDLPGDAK